jgi:Leucine-rich repeat (LRR) protein
MHNNKINGTIPREIGNLINLQSLNLSSNALTGPIPSEFSKLVNLKALQLERNSFATDFPAPITKLVNLQRLTLQNNQFTGVLPASLGDMVNLQYLDLGFNNFTGSLPFSIADLLPWERLTYFNMNGNPRFVQSSRSITPTQSDCSTVLRVYNLLGGSRRLPQDPDNNCCDWNNVECATIISGTWWESPQLFGVNFDRRATKIFWQRENLRGSLSPIVSNLDALLSLSLTGNFITGTLPSSLGNLSSLETLEINNNKISGNIPESFSNFRNLTRL